MHKADRAIMQGCLSDGVRDIFEALSRESTDKISKRELLEGLQNLGLPHSQDILSDIFAQADANNNGFIDYSSLLGFVQPG